VSLAGGAGVAGLCATLGWIAIILLAAAPKAAAQQLSLRHYNVSEGLAGSSVGSIYQDAKGYLWFGTTEGLSRFDGYRFTNYGVRDGLPNPLVNHIVADPQGRLWVATNGGGIAVFDDNIGQTPPPLRKGEGYNAGKKFTSFSVGAAGYSNQVDNLLFDAHGYIWCGTDGGIYRTSGPSDAQPSFELVVAHRIVGRKTGRVWGDSAGRVWANVGDLIQIIDGRTIKYELPNGIDGRDLADLVEDSHHRLFVAFLSAVFEFIPSTDLSGRAQWREIYGGAGIECIMADETGTVWVGTDYGLVKCGRGSPARYTTDQRLSNDAIRALEQDSDGNVWIGMGTGGVCKLETESIVSFTTKQGMPEERIESVVEGIDGRIYASTYGHGIVEIAGGRVWPLPGSAVPPISIVRSRVIQDARGYWWIGADDGLYGFRGPNGPFADRKKYTQGDGIREEAIYGSHGASIYQDSAGSVWVSSERYLYQCDRDSRGGVHFHELPLKYGDSWVGGVVVMLMDRTGVLWVATYDGLYRLGMDKTLVAVEPAPELPVSQVRAIFQDSRGWLWLGLRYSGVSVIRDFGKGPIVALNYSTQNGLASDTVWSITEDDSGRMYLGTAKGLDQLDPSTEVIHHFTVEDGLAGTEVTRCIKDSQGNIWIATIGGVTRLDPNTLPGPTGTPPIYLTRVQVAGEDIQLPDGGATRPPKFEVAAARNNLLIEFVGVSFQGAHGPQYQYRLDGVDQDWSAPGPVRSVNYARLAPRRLPVRGAGHRAERARQPTARCAGISDPAAHLAAMVVPGDSGGSAVGDRLHRLPISSRSIH